MRKAESETPQRRKRKVKRPVSPQQRLEQQEKRSARKRLLTMSSFVLVTLILTLAMIQMIIRSTAPNPKLFIVQRGTIFNEIYGDALIVRDERILSAPAAGMFQAAANDGEKVRKDAVLGRVLAPAGEDIWDELATINLELSTKQLELIAEGGMAAAETEFTSTDAKLLPLVNQLRMLDAKTDLISGERLADRIQVMIDARNARLLDIDFDDAALEALFERKAKAEEKLASAAKDLKSPESGIISYNPDALAGTLNGENILTKSAAALEQMTGQQNFQHFSPSREVRKGEHIAFLVRDIYQHFVFVLPGQKAVDFPLDRRYALDLADEGISIDNCELIQAKEEDGKLIVILRTESELEPLITQRVVRGRILLESDRGLKIPREALVFDGSGNYAKGTVMLLRSGYIYEESVEVQRMDENYAIISSPIGATYELREGSIIVQNPNAVKAGEQIGG